MNNLIITILKNLLGMKFGWLIAVVIGLLIGGSLIKNIFSGSFNVAKFAGGFNIFAGGVQGKLLYYGLIIFGCFCVFHFIMRPTNSYDTDYKNQIHDNQDVLVDQRVGATCIPTKILWGLIQIGCNSDAIQKNINNNNCDCNNSKPKTNIIPRGKNDL